MTLTIADIVEGVLAVSDENSDEQSFHRFVYKNLDVRRVQQTPGENAHLANPLNDQIGGFNAREDPLDGSEPVRGDYLTLHFGTQDDAVFLLCHPSLSELENVILGDGGVFNPFTKWIYSIIHGKVRQYDATFARNNQRVVFSKNSQMACECGNNGATDLRPFVERQIVWTLNPIASAANGESGIQ